MANPSSGIKIWCVGCLHRPRAGEDFDRAWERCHQDLYEEKGLCPLVFWRFLGVIDFAVLNKNKQHGFCLEFLGFPKILVKFFFLV